MFLLVLAETFFSRIGTILFGTSRTSPAQAWFLWGLPVPSPREYRGLRAPVPRGSLLDAQKGTEKPPKPMVLDSFVLPSLYRI